MPILSTAEIRNAARGLLRAPTVTASAVLCLALGIGATTTISSAIDRVLVRPLPFRDPGRLVSVFRTNPHVDDGPFSAPNYVDFARDTRQLDGMAAASFPSGGVLAIPGQAAYVTVERVTGNFFALLGQQPALGRLLTPLDGQDDQNPVAVVSEELWRERFGADSSLVGRTVRLDGQPRTIVGIVPAGFRVPHGGLLIRAQLWVPMRFTAAELESRRGNNFLAFGRLASTASVSAAQAEFRSMFSRLALSYPALRGEGMRVVPMHAEGVRAVRSPLLLLFAAVCAVLLIAATNVASLLLARGIGRRRELAIRKALGGHRGAIMRPVLVESLLLASVGGALGLLIAWVGVRTIGALAATQVPQLAGLGVDLPLVAFALALSVVVAVVCGAVPAWRAAAADPTDALDGGRGGGGGLRHHRALSALVVAEIALSLVLLIGAGLVLRGFASLVRKDPGFDPTAMLTLQATVSRDRYADTAAVRQFLEPALAAIRQIPGVDAVAAVGQMPYVNWGWGFGIRYEGQAGVAESALPSDESSLPSVENEVVTPDFFRVTRQRLIRGRLLRQDDDDRKSSPSVVVVNEALAARDFPSQNPIGRRFYTGDSTFTTIVGVVTNIRNAGPVAPPQPAVYSTFRQSGPFTNFPIIVRVDEAVRSDAVGGSVAVDPSTITASVRTAIHTVDPEAAVTDVRPMTDVISASVGTPRFYLTLLASFAIVALVLAMAGLYGVMSYTVAQRTRELGIRSALGSSNAALVRHTARRGLRLIALGLTLGAAASSLTTHLLTQLLYGVPPTDPKTWLATTLLLTSAALLATLLPALRAARVDPLTAIRAE